MCRSVLSKMLQNEESAVLVMTKLCIFCLERVANRGGTEL